MVRAYAHNILKHRITISTIFVLTLYSNRCARDLVHGGDEDDEDDDDDDDNLSGCLES